MGKGAVIPGQKFAAVVLLLVISFIISNKVFFVHTHIDSNGNAVTHSHPYNKGTEKLPLNSHNHTDAVLSLLATTDQAVIQPSCIFNLISDRLEEKICDKYSISYTYSSVASAPGRGPPAI